jgi:hypothetical protein
MKIRNVKIVAVAKIEIPKKKNPTVTKMNMEINPNRLPYSAYANTIVAIRVFVKRIDSTVPIIISLRNDIDVVPMILHRNPHPIEPTRRYDT